MGFDEKDFNSDDGIVTFIWGPSMWNFLHMMSFQYPVKPSDTDKKKYKAFIEQLTYVLPCGSCRDNLNINLKTVKLLAGTMKSRDTFSKFVYDLHNQINVMLGKSMYASFEQVSNKYDAFRLRCPRGLADSKCVIQIVPRSCKDQILKVDPKCQKNGQDGGNLTQEIDNAMIPEIWGPCLWHFLHCVSFNYPVDPSAKQKKDYGEFIHLIGYILPDEISKKCFKQNIKDSKFSNKSLKNRSVFSKWMYDFHNVVNKRTGKSKSKESLDQNRNKYENFRSRCLTNPSKNRKKETGCTDSMYGIKAKSTIHIVPKKNRKKNMKIDPKCIVKKNNKI